MQLWLKTLARLHTMYISIPSILLGLGGKCLLDWALVLLQRDDICKSLLGVFSVSLAVVDTILTLFFAALHFHADGFVFLLGSKLTRYHVCLLVQILGEVYNALQWPVAVAAGCDHFSTVARRPHAIAGGTRFVARFLVTGLLWHATVLYVFLLSDFRPVMEDVPHGEIRQCWVVHTTQILQVAMVLLLSLGCAVLHAGFSTRFLTNPPSRDQVTEQSGAHSRRDAVHRAGFVFLNTWAPFLCFLAVLLLAPVGIPAYLGLNAAWLAFLNSFLIAVALCAVGPASRITQGPAAVPPDSFCEWRFPFILAGEDGT